MFRCSSTFEENGEKEEEEEEEKEDMQSKEVQSEGVSFQFSVFSFKSVQRFHRSAYQMSYIHFTVSVARCLFPFQSASFLSYLPVHELGQHRLPRAEGTHEVSALEGVPRCAEDMHL